MKTDIIIPVYNNLYYTRRCLNSIKNHLNDYNLIIIDNGSDEITKKYLSKLNCKIIANSKNLGYVRAINQGLKISNSPFVLLLNNDVIVTPNFLKNMICKTQAGFDLVGPLTNIKLNSKSENKQLIDFNYPAQNRYILNFATNINRKNKFIEVSYLFGHCLLLTRNVIKKVGLLDKRYGIGNFDDLDYCKRARGAGFKICIATDSFVYHFCHKTFEKMNINIENLIEKNKKIYEEKWR